MFSIIRRGPKSLIIESNNVLEVKRYLSKNFNASRKCDLKSAFQQANEECTIIFIVEKAKDIINSKECLDIFIIQEEPDVILCRVLNNDIKKYITYSRIAPRIIFMRVFGDLNKIIEKIEEDNKERYVKGDVINILENYNDKGTIVAFTDKPLRKTFNVSDIYKEALYIEEKYSTLIRKMRTDALRYLNAGLDNKDWYEIEIKIYDIYGAYNLHYDRLLKILEGLELGVILGESWSKDYPRLFMAVGVYRVRFFTFYDPKYIKKILVGAEFLEDGMRIIDYDVYYNRKKINWTDVIENNLRSKNLLSEKYRKEILNKIQKSDLDDIKLLESEIIKTRS